MDGFKFGACMDTSMNSWTVAKSFEVCAIQFICFHVF